MKKIFQWTALLMLCVLGACSEDALDGLSGKYDVERYVCTKVVTQSTDKLRKGVKRLNILLETVRGNQWQMCITCGDWVLQGGVYQVQTSSFTENVEIGTLIGAVDNNGFASGKLEVTLLDGVYYLDGLFQGTDGTSYACDYKGPISFVIGEDDPEPSGYTAILTTSPVYQLDANNQPVGIIPGVAKYAFSVSDPNGNGVAQFDLINKENLTLEELGGSYRVTGTAEPGSMDAGNALPADWGGWSWGSYFASNGTKQYIMGGTLDIAVVTGMEGETLLSFSGKELLTTLGMDVTGAQVPGTANRVDIRFVTVLQSTGYEMRDQQMESAVMGRKMPFSVYLPKSYDGQKEYPVLYLLHGADGNHNDWMAQGMLNPYASAAEAAGGKEIIIVCPNGSPDGQNIFYCDNYQGNNMKYMTYFFDEFIPYVESNFKVKAGRGSRAIAGLSMGGYGSLYYGLLHPEMFCYVYACSPATYVDGAPNLYEMLGTQGLPGLTIEIGTGDFLFESAGYFKQALDGSGIANEYITRDGIHDWAFWRGCLPKMLKRVSDTFE
ncbi:MAG: alpha/beta hydrolase [Bacteroides sp.]